MKERLDISECKCRQSPFKVACPMTTSCTRSVSRGIWRVTGTCFKSCNWWLYHLLATRPFYTDDKARHRSQQVSAFLQQNAITTIPSIYRNWHKQCTENGNTYHQTSPGGHVTAIHAIDNLVTGRHVLAKTEFFVKTYEGTLKPYLIQVPILSTWNEMSPKIQILLSKMSLLLSSFIDKESLFRDNKQHVVVLCLRLEACARFNPMVQVYWPRQTNDANMSNWQLCVYVL